MPRGKHPGLPKPLLRTLIQARAQGYVAGFYSRPKSNPYSSGLPRTVWALGYDTGAHYRATYVPRNRLAEGG